jgi:hypothetical protein
VVQWARRRPSRVPDGSWKQYQFLHEKVPPVGRRRARLGTVSASPRTRRRRGSSGEVLWGINRNGKILDVSERAGEVREMDPGNFFTHAAYIPGMAEDIDTDATA